MKTAIINNIRQNIMGTTSFEMKAGSMRKPQEFIVYPKQKDDVAKEIQVQSDNYIAAIDLQNGKGQLSQRHSNPVFAHLQIDKAKGKLQKIQLSELDAQALRMHIFATADEEAGESVVKTDNSGAINILG